LLKRLGANHVINYREDENWGLTARTFTPNGDGFDNIVEVGGTNTLSQSVKAIKFEGVITVIGVLTGAAQGSSNVIDALLKICTFRGLHVGSRVQMEEMMAAIEANKIQPVLDDKVFSLEEVRDGLEYLVRLITPLKKEMSANTIDRPHRSMWVKSWLELYRRWY
jgi:NADPH:quinone reductase-like Zn-dependent oxidoreductase